MASSPQAVARLKIKTVAQAAFTANSFDTARVKLGLADISESTEFFATLISAGPFLVVLPAITSGFNTTTGIQAFKVPCQLYFGFARNADYDFTAIEDSLYAPTTGIITQLGNYSLYTSSPVPQSLEISPEPDIKTDLTVVSALYQFDINFYGSN